MLLPEAKALHDHLTHGLQLYSQLVQALPGTNRDGLSGTDSRMFRLHLRELNRFLDSCNDKLSGNIEGGLQPDHYAAIFVDYRASGDLSPDEERVTMRWDQGYLLELHGQQLQRKRTPPPESPPPPGKRRRIAHRKYAGPDPPPPLGPVWRNPPVMEYRITTSPRKEAENSP